MRLGAPEESRSLARVGNSSWHDDIRNFAARGGSPDVAREAADIVLEQDNDIRPQAPEHRLCARTPAAAKQKRNAIAERRRIAQQGPGTARHVHERTDARAQRRSARKARSVL